MSNVKKNANVTNNISEALMSSSSENICEDQMEIFPTQLKDAADAIKFQKIIEMQQTQIQSTKQSQATNTINWKNWSCKENN